MQNNRYPRTHYKALIHCWNYNQQKLSFALVILKMSAQPQRLNIFCLLIVGGLLYDIISPFKFATV